MTRRHTLTPLGWLVLFVLAGFLIPLIIWLLS